MVVVSDQKRMVEIWYSLYTFCSMAGCWNSFFRGGSVKLVGWLWFGRTGTGGGEVLEASVVDVECRRAVSDQRRCG